MTKNSVNKMLLLLGLTSCFAINTVSAKKNNNAEEAVALPEGVTRESFKTVNTPKLLVKKKAVMVKEFLTNQINPWKTNVPQGTSKELNIDNYIPDPNGTIVVGGTAINFIGETAIDPKKKLLVNEINPVKKDTTTGKLVIDDCGTTCFSGNTAVHPGKILLVNEINPVQLDEVTGECIKNDAGMTCFSGSVAIKPTHENLLKSARVVNLPETTNLFLVNTICPLTVETEVDEYDQPVLDACGNQIQTCVADDCGTTCFTGNTAIHPEKFLMANDVTPVSFDEKAGECVQNTEGTTCFHGNIAIKPETTCDYDTKTATNYALLTNKISPVKMDCQLDEYDNPVLNECGNEIATCVADDSLCAYTHFTGGIKIKDGRHLGQIDGVVLSELDTPVAVLKLRFAALDGSNCYPATVRLNYNAFGLDDYDNCFSVTFDQDFVVSPIGTVFNALNTAVTVNSAAFGGTIVATADKVENGFVDLYVSIYVTGSTNDLPLTGCLSYDVAGCSNLLEIECNPELILG